MFLSVAQKTRWIAELENAIIRINFKADSLLILAIFKTVLQEGEVLLRSSINVVSQSNANFFLSTSQIISTISGALLPTIFTFLSQKACCFFYIRLVIM